MVSREKGTTSNSLWLPGPDSWQVNIYTIILNRKYDYLIFAYILFIRIILSYTGWLLPTLFLILSGWMGKDFNYSYSNWRLSTNKCTKFISEKIFIFCNYNFIKLIWFIFQFSTTSDVVRRICSINAKYSLDFKMCVCNKSRNSRALPALR